MNSASLEGFRKYSVAAQLERAPTIIRGIGRADHYYRDFPVARTFSEALQHFVAGFAGDVHIQHQDVGSRSTGPGVERHPGCGSPFRRRRPPPGESFHPIPGGRDERGRRRQGLSSTSNTEIGWWPLRLMPFPRQRKHESGTAPDL
jgi:hypothetical protein